MLFKKILWTKSIIHPINFEEIIMTVQSLVTEKGTVKIRLKGFKGHDVLKGQRMNVPPSFPLVPGHWGFVA